MQIYFNNYSHRFQQNRLIFLLGANRPGAKRLGGRNDLGRNAAGAKRPGGELDLGRNDPDSYQAVVQKVTIKIWYQLPSGLPKKRQEVTRSVKRIL